MWMLVNNDIPYFYGSANDCMDKITEFFPDRTLLEVMKMGWIIEDVERGVKIRLAK